MTMSDPIKELLAKQEITEQIYRYCRGMDRMDNDLAISVWHPDGNVYFAGRLFKETREDYVLWTEEIHKALVSTSHQISNILIQVDGDRAVSESYVTAVLRSKEDNRLIDRTLRGRYLDHWSYRDGCWAIDRREFAHDFTSIQQVETDNFKVTGKRDKSDLSYSLSNKW